MKNIISICLASAIVIFILLFLATPETVYAPGESTNISANTSANALVIVEVRQDALSPPLGN